MVKITYEILEHDGGWAYRVNGAYSESFPSHDDALAAARIAASAQKLREDEDQAIYSMLSGPIDQEQALHFEILDRSRGMRRFNLSDHA